MAYTIKRNDTDETIATTRRMTEAALIAEIDSDEIAWALEEHGRCDVLLVLDLKAVECRIEEAKPEGDDTDVMLAKFDDVLRMEPKPASLVVWSYCVTDYGIARDDPDSFLDFPARQAYRTAEEAKAAVEADVREQYAEIREEDPNYPDPDIQWTQDGDDWLFQDEMGSPDEVRYRVHSIKVL